MNKSRTSISAHIVDNSWNDLGQLVVVVDFEAEATDGLCVASETRVGDLRARDSSRMPLFLMGADRAELPVVHDDDQRTQSLVGCRGKFICIHHEFPVAADCDSLAASVSEPDGQGSGYRVSHRPVAHRQQ